MNWMWPLIIRSGFLSLRQEEHPKLDSMGSGNGQ